MLIAFPSRYTENIIKCLSKNVQNYAERKTLYMIIYGFANETVVAYVLVIIYNMS